MIEAPPTSRRARWLVGAGLILLGIAGLGVWAMRTPGAVSYFVTPSEVNARGPSAQTFRLGGRVAPATLVRKGSSVTFAVVDDKAAVRVAYRGEVPDTLKEGTDVVAEGRLREDGVLAADRVMAKCSSRFVPKVEREARARART